MRTLGRWLVAGLVLLFARRRAHPPPYRRRIVEPWGPHERAELVVAFFAVLATASAIAFITAYAIEDLATTQVLGVTIGLAFAFLAAAAILLAKRALPDEQKAEPYPEPEHPVAQEEIDQIAGESRDALTRRRLLMLTLGGAATAIGAALLVPVASLGPVFHTKVLYRAPWRRGVRLVDADGAPLVASAIDEKSLWTAFPQGADPELVGSPVVVVRLPPGELDLPAGRENWAPDGLVAYSKSCTHAGCAVALYRTPTFAPTQPGPALVCPCHYSTFDPRTGAKVLFGPAGRPLPQLPLEIDADGALIAAGPLSGPPGPSFGGMKT